MTLRNKTVKRLLSVWYLFVAWLAVVAVLFTLVIGMVTAYAPHEQISIFIAAYDVDSDGLNEKLSGKKGYIENIKITASSAPYNEVMFNADWMQATIVGTDIYILPTSKAPAEACNAYFLPLTDETVSEYFVGRELYKADGKIYGVKIYDGANNIGGSCPYITYAQENAEKREDYWLFFGKHTVHISDEYNGGIALAKTLLSE